MISRDSWAIVRNSLAPARWTASVTQRVSDNCRRVRADHGNQRLGAALLDRNGFALAPWRVAEGPRRHQPVFAPAARQPLCRPRDGSAARTSIAGALHRD